MALEKGAVFAYMLGSTLINPLVSLDNINLIIDRGYKVVLCLNFLVVQSMLTLSNCTVSLLVTLLFLVVVIRPFLVSLLTLTGFTIFDHMNLGDMLL